MGLRTFRSASLLSVLCLPLLVACSGGSDAPSAKVSVSLPATISQAASSVNGKDGDTPTLVAKHFVINVSGGDLAAPLLLTWDSCDNCSTPSVPPSSFDFEITKGDRLVQVLGIYSGSGDQDGAYFYYGDQSATLVAGANAVNVQIAMQFATKTLTSGMISGRYMPLVGIGPTGQLFVQWAPPDKSKPKMRIGSSSIAAGWFNVFGLKEMALSYVTDGGIDLFDGASISLGAVNGNPRVMKIETPAMTIKSGSGSFINSNSRQAKIFVAGFFGPGSIAAQKRACFVSPINYPSISRSLDSTGVTQTPYAVGSSSTAVSVVGGSLCSVADLSNATLSENDAYLAFRPNVFNGRAQGEAPVNFESIFTSDTANDIDASIGAISIAPARESTDALIRFRYLRDIDSSVVRSVHIFKRVMASSSDGSKFNDEIPCEAMAAGRINGFNLINTLPVPSSWSSLAQEVRLPIVASEVGLSEFALCPIKGGKYLSGVQLRAERFPRSQGPAQLVLQLASGTMIQGTVNLSAGVCVPFTVYERGATGPVIRANDTAVTLSATLSGTSSSMSSSFYSTSLCTNPISNITIPAGSSTATVYLRAGTSAESGQLSANLAGLASNSLPVLVSNSTPNARLAFVNEPAGGGDAPCSAIDAFLMDPTVAQIVRPISAALPFFASVLPNGGAELRTACDSASLPIAAEASVTFSRASSGSDAGDSAQKLYVRTLDPSKETEIKLRDGSGNLTYSVLNPKLQLSNSARPRVWLQPEPRYLPLSVDSGGGVATISGWLSRVNGFMFDGQSGVTLGGAAGSHVLTLGSYGYVKRTGLDATSFNLDRPITGFIMVQPSSTANIRLVTVSTNFDAPSTSSTAAGFDLIWSASNRLQGTARSAESSAITPSADTSSTAVQVVKFKFNRSGQTDTLSFGVNNGVMYSAQNSWTTKPVVNQMTLGNNASPVSTGSIYEVILFDQDLDSTRMSEVYAYLQKKYPAAALP